MLVKDVCPNLEGSLVARSPLWMRDVAGLSTLDIQVFIRGFYGLQTQYEAMRQAEVLIDTIWNAMMRKEVETCRAVFFQAPQVRITYDELNSWLMPISVARRRAVLFALETGFNTKEVIELTWSSVRFVELSDFARMLVQANPRHIKLEYVFWEITPVGVCAPLFGLENSMLEVAQGMGIGALRRLYKDIIPVDQEMEKENFIDEVCNEYRQRVALKN